MPRPGTIIVGDYHSHGSYDKYTTCGYRYYQQKVRKIPERPSVYLAGGKAVHSTIEYFEWEVRLGNDLNKVTHDQIHAAWQHEWGKEVQQLRDAEPDENRWAKLGKATAAKPNAEDAEWWAKAGYDMTMTWVHWRRENQDRFTVASIPSQEDPSLSEPAIEMEFQTKRELYTLLGYADIILEDVTNGSLLLVDWKTGTRQPNSTLQLGTYAVQWNELHPDLASVGHGTWFMARTGGMREPPFDLALWTPERIYGIYDKLDHAIREEIFLPVIGGHCFNCPVKKSCAYYVSSY